MRGLFAFYLQFIYTPGPVIAGGKKKIAILIDTKKYLQNMSKPTRIKLLPSLDAAQVQETICSPANCLIYHFISENTGVCHVNDMDYNLVIIKLLPTLSMPSTHELLQLIIQIDDYLHESPDNIVFLSFSRINRSKARCVMGCILSFFNYYESPFDYIATLPNNLSYFNSQLLFMHYFNKILLNIYPNSNVLQLKRIIINMKTLSTCNYHFQLYNGAGEHIATLQPTSSTENTLLFTDLSIDEMFHDDVHVRLRSIDRETDHVDTVFRTTLYLGYIDGIARVTKANIDSNHNIESNFFMDMFFIPFGGIRRDIFSAATSSKSSECKPHEDVEQRITNLFELVKVRRKCSELKKLPQQKRPIPSKFTISASPSPSKSYSNKENNRHYNDELIATISEINEFLGEEIMF